MRGVSEPSTAALISLRSAMAAVVLTGLVAMSSMAPESPDRVRWLGLFWLSVYGIATIVQTLWLGWRWLSSRRFGSPAKNRPL
jgi:hypothetical protein